MNKADEYLNVLHNVYLKENKEKYWENIVFGKITKEEERQLSEKNIPKALIDLLKIINGSSAYDSILGTYDDILIPYCLFSGFEILNSMNNDYYTFVSEIYEYTPEYVDDRIDVNNKELIWANIGEDSYNNGGTSSLFIDFTPSSKGKVGQVVVFIHDEDRLFVIADSFEEYLDKLIKAECPFIKSVL